MTTYPVDSRYYACCVSIGQHASDCTAAAALLATCSDLEIIDELMLRVSGLTATPADVQRALDEVLRRAVNAFRDATGAQRAASVELIEALQGAARALDALDALDALNGVEHR